MYSRFKVYLSAAVAAVLVVSATISLYDVDLTHYGLSSEPAYDQALDEMHLERKFLKLSETVFKVRSRQPRTHEQQDCGLCIHRYTLTTLHCSTDTDLNLRRQWKVIDDDSKAHGLFRLLSPPIAISFPLMFLLVRLET